MHRFFCNLRQKAPLHRCGWRFDPLFPVHKDGDYIWVTNQYDDVPDAVPEHGRGGS